MTKTEAYAKRMSIVDAATLNVAYERGRIARAYNRPQTCVLVPKFETDAERDQYEQGWKTADEQIANA